ncbi:MAG: TIGR02281 family clan AA aspartic protease [Hyphomicrobiaceae bacterium]
MAAWIALALLVVAGLVLVVAPGQGSALGLDTTNLALVVAGVATVIFVGVPLAGQYRGRLAAAARDLLVWGAILLALVAAYGFRDQLQMVASRVMEELTPAGTDLGVATETAGEQAVRLRKRSDGHFVARAVVEGTQITMLIDTGASSVVLKSTDAERAGIDTGGLAYVVPVQTANGTAFAARTRLKSVAVGTIAYENVEALIAQAGALDESLLGMSFLSRLGSYEFSGDYLTLRSGRSG